MKAIVKHVMVHGVAVAGYMIVVNGVSKGADLLVKKIQDKKKGA